MANGLSIQGNVVTNGEDRDIAITVYKLLLRGSVIYNSKYTEDFLNDHFLNRQLVDWPLLLKKAISQDNKPIYSRYYDNFDSIEEKIFYEHIWPNFLEFHHSNLSFHS